VAGGAGTFATICSKMSTIPIPALMYRRKLEIESKN
jgi:hypothetical protein